MKKPKNHEEKTLYEELEEINKELNRLEKRKEEVYNLIVEKDLEAHWQTLRNQENASRA